MDFATTTGKTIKQAFDEFHEANPDVYTKFKDIAYELLIVRKKKKISSKMIINQIRWLYYVEIEEDKTDKNYRINDAYTPYYARLFAEQYPQFADRIEMRRIRSGE